MNGMSSIVPARIDTSICGSEIGTEELEMIASDMLDLRREESQPQMNTESHRS
jgi:hypothetical protein